MANTSKIQQFFDEALKLVKQAGQIIIDASNEQQSYEKKLSPHDLVTKYDTQIEHLIISGLREKFSDHKFIGEETAVVGEIELTDDPTWMIDPIDGTMNFIHSFPYCCVSVALLIKKKVEIGIVYNPRADKLYTAKRGQGSFCNNKQLKVSSVEKLKEALVLTEVGAFRDSEAGELLMKNLDRFFHEAHSLRSLGSAALNLCTVAAGEADVYAECGIHCWDMAAGVIIAKEAGAVITSTNGAKFDMMSRKIICANCPQVSKSVSEIFIGTDSFTTDSKEPCFDSLPVS